MACVLLIDNDDVARSQNRETLMFAGFQADMALIGAQALKMLESNRYDCIVTDMDLPDMDGVSLCEQIRLLTQAPLLFLIETDDAELRTRAYMAGCDGTMQKPCSAKLLSTWVSLKVERYREAIARNSAGGGIKQESNATKRQE